MNKELSQKGPGRLNGMWLLRRLVFLVPVYQWVTSLDKAFFFSPSPIPDLIRCCYTLFSLQGRHKRNDIKVGTQQNNVEKTRRRCGERGSVTDSGVPSFPWSGWRPWDACERVCTRARVCRAFGKGAALCRSRRAVENKPARALPRWRWYLFSLAPHRQGSPHPIRLLSFRAARAHALMPAGWPCIVIIQSSCSHHVSSDQRRVYKVKGSCKIYAYMAVSVSGKINTAGLMHRNDWVLSDWH